MTRKEQIIELRNQGLYWREIAEKFGVSTSRVQQIAFGRLPLPRYIRFEILYRDGQKCLLCDNSSLLSIHHINHDVKDNRMSNLVTLCRPCHKKVDFIDFKTNYPRQFVKKYSCIQCGEKIGDKSSKYCSKICRSNWWKINGKTTTLEKMREFRRLQARKNYQKQKLSTVTESFKNAIM